MTPSKWQTAIGALLFAFLLIFSPNHSLAQAAKRRVVTRSTPAYPSMARTMAIEGVVKLDALVAPDGTVKKLDVKGGHPLLAQAAVESVRQWRWEPAAHESHEVVEVKFSPSN